MARIRKGASVTAAPAPPSDAIKDSQPVKPSSSKIPPTKGATESTANEKGPEKIRKRAKGKRSQENYRSDIRKFVSGYNSPGRPEYRLSARSLAILDQCMLTVAGKLADETKKLAGLGKVKTLQPSHAKGAIQILFSGELGKFATANSQKVERLLSELKEKKAEKQSPRRDKNLIKDLTRSH